MPFNLPIFLTWLRVALIPLVVGVYYLPQEWLLLQEKNQIAASIFILAAITDWLDGFLARRWNQTSAFGAFLDPVADKLMVAAALLVLLAQSRVSVLVALIIIGREITISALREWMAQMGASRSVAVNMLGKLKTATQMIAIPLLLWEKSIFEINIKMMGTVFLGMAAILTVWSMFYYLQKAWPSIRERQDKI